MLQSGARAAHTCCTCSRRAAGWPGSPRSRSAAGSSVPALCCSPAPPVPRGSGGTSRAHGGEQTDGDVGSEGLVQVSLPEPPLWQGGGWEPPPGMWGVGLRRGGRLHGALGGGLPHVSLRCLSIVADNRGQSATVGCYITPTSSSCLARKGRAPSAAEAGQNQALQQLPRLPRPSAQPALLL